MTTWDLQYMLLFGPPENKLELLDAKAPCSFPFVDRDITAKREAWDWGEK